jgi:hypothetical protein
MVVLGAVWAGLLARVILILRVHESLLYEACFGALLLAVTLAIARAGARQHAAQNARPNAGDDDHRV